MTRKKRLPENEKLRGWRKGMGYLQGELAGLLGVSRPTYAGYESGGRLPSAYAVLQLARIFDVPVCDMYESFEQSGGYVPLDCIETKERRYMNVCGQKGAEGIPKDNYHPSDVAARPAGCARPACG